MKINIKNQQLDKIQESTLTLVKVPAGFGCDEMLVSETPITEGQWRDVMGGEILNGNNFPKTNVNFDEAREFCRKASLGTEFNFNLPTIIQHCRYLGLEPSNISDFAVFDADNLVEVKTKLPNEYGLYDVRGLVWEWAESNEQYKYLCGGSWIDFRLGARAVCRDGFLPASRNDVTGFRLVVLRPPSV